jgi:hypothetical protein
MIKITKKSEVQIYLSNDASAYRTSNKTLNVLKKLRLMLLTLKMTIN